MGFEAKDARRVVVIKFGVLKVETVKELRRIKNEEES